MTDFSAVQGRPCPAWYAAPQLGVFIHWGMFAVPAWAPRGASITDLTLNRYDEVFTLAPYAEWYANALRIPESPTAAHHAQAWGGRPYERFRDDFERAAAAFDSGAWADLFAAAGAGYVVFVTKHHDGYCLWPSDVENPRRPGWRSDRDYVGELAQAVRARGLRFGVYYSGGLDWTFKADPIRDVGDMFACVPTTPDYQAYADAQVRELIARYRPSVLWNDIAWPDKRGLPSLFADYYAAVPDGVVNDRWLAEAALFDGLADPQVRRAFNDRNKARLASHAEYSPRPPHCDFRTVEYGAGASGGGQKWESTRGLGLAFGYNANERDEDYMSSADLIALYDEVTGGGGNLLINVGPRADGSVLTQQSTPLKALGAHIKGG
ncbi:MAG TPA: alpha-L-fucosidase [Caulobacteraceae bacterium]|jgi:alpha-L-fucosidase